MNISSLLSSGMYSYLDGNTSTKSTSSTSSGTSNTTSDSFDSVLSTLESAINKGNLSSAQTALQQVEASSPRTTNGTDPVGTFLTSVEKALSSGDISSAQTALKTFEASPSPSSAGGGGGFESDLSNLESAINSGDLVSAKTYLASIESRSPSNTSSTTSTTATSATDTSSTSSTSSSDPIGTFLKKVESALSSDSLTAAQSALTAFQAQPYPAFLTSAITSSLSSVSFQAQAFVLGTIDFVGRPFLRQLQFAAPGSLNHEELMRCHHSHVLKLPSATILTMSFAGLVTATNA